MPHVCQPGGKWFEEFHHHCLGVGGCHRFDRIVWVGSGNQVCRADRHLPGKDEIVGGEGCVVRPFDIIP